MEFALEKNQSPLADKGQITSKGRAQARFRRPVLARLGRQKSCRSWPGEGEIDIPKSILQAWKCGRKSPQPVDLVSPVRISSLARLIIFLVDVSDSMHTALDWMQIWLSTAMRRAYLRRDPVAVIVVQGQEARVLVHPTTSLGLVAHRLSLLTVGGGTPLDRGLAVLRRVMLQHRDEYPSMDLCLLTDARSTGSLDTPEVAEHAALIRRQAREILVVNPGSASGKPDARPDRFMYYLAQLLRANVASG